MPLATVADDASLSLSLLPDASFSLKPPSAVESLSRTLDFDHWSRGSGTTSRCCCSRCSRAPERGFPSKASVQRGSGNRRRRDESVLLMQMHACIQLQTLASLLLSWSLHLPSLTADAHTCSRQSILAFSFFRVSLSLSHPLTRSSRDAEAGTRISCLLLPLLLPSSLLLGSAC